MSYSNLYCSIRILSKIVQNIKILPYFMQNRRRNLGREHFLSCCRPFYNVNLCERMKYFSTIHFDNFTLNLERVMYTVGEVRRALQRAYIQCVCL
jgi:hypothetical protein